MAKLKNPNLPKLTQTTKRPNDQTTKRPNFTRPAVSGRGPNDQRNMSIVIIAPYRKTDALKQRLESLLPGTPIYNSEPFPEPDQVKMAILWKQPSHALRPFSNLQLIHSLGAGVDHITNDVSIPAHLPIVRIVDEQLTTGMRRYVVMAVLNHHKNLYYHLRQQKNRSWSGIDTATNELKIGVLGLGVLGQDVAHYLASLDFEVMGFSRLPKTIGGVKCFSDQEGELPLFLSKINTLICLLPLTEATNGILNYSLFKQMQPNSYLINVGRGAHLVDDDLLKAIKEGHMVGACLDVLNQEPLPPDHPFWANEKITLTPHIASITNQESAAQQMAENY
ncbi:MAG: glyoxylate/hydroxypyruvate reductase A, partial [Chloroflexota bacterium]